jgi:hypothetical protein
MGLCRTTFGRADHVRRVFDAVRADSDCLVDRSGRMGVRGHRQTGGVCVLDQQPQLLDRELGNEHVGARGDQAAACHYLDHVNLSLHPFSYGTHDLVFAADLAAEVAAVSAWGGDRRTRGNNPGQPVVHLPLRVSPFDDIEVPIAEVTDRRHTSGELASQRLADHGVDLFRRVPGSPVQRHHVAVADEVDMRVDQPRQDGRIAVVDQLTIGGQLVPHRLDADNATVLDENSDTAGAEIFTVEGLGCPDREHTAWLSKPIGACQRASHVRNQHEASELRL